MFAHVVLAPLLFILAAPEPPAAPCSPAGERPRLVVLISVDQLVPDQLERLEAHLHGGLGRMVRGGLVFRNATLEFARSETGAGHASYGTGTLPRSHGVVGNSFFDRTLGRTQYCVEDRGVLGLTVDGPTDRSGLRSPKNLQRPTLGEHVQAALPGAMSVSASAKDRAAIGMGGRSTGPVLWWDKGGSGFQSSTFYGDALPAFVREWNAGWADVARGWPWESTVPPDATALGTAPDERPGERPFLDQGVTFPYRLPETDNAQQLAGLSYGTPLVDRFTAEIAVAAVRAMGLGADDATDVLALSFSGCDVVGHANGPFSHEVTDVLLRLDRSLGALFDELDERVGPGRWIAALSADHGVLPLPENLAGQGIAGRRLIDGEVGAFRKELRARMTDRLGRDVRVERGNGGLTLDRGSLEKSGLDLGTASAALLAITRELAPTQPWIEGVYGYDEVAALGADATGVEALLRDSFHPERVTDVVVLPAPHVLVGLRNGTSHGTHHRYDRHVPLIFYGPGFARGTRSDTVGTHDAVPTLLARLGITPLSPLDGRDLLRDLSR
ncbi:MAG: alkaline phosphatase family protein [Planctomycetota bacterium]